MNGQETRKKLMGREKKTIKMESEKVNKIEIQNDKEQWSRRQQTSRRKKSKDKHEEKQIRKRKSDGEERAYFKLRNERRHPIPLTVTHLETLS